MKNYILILTLFVCAPQRDNTSEARNISLLASAVQADPATALTIAKFAYSIYEFIHYDPIDPNYKIILEYLNQINTKLDIISSKLDNIYYEIKRLPTIIDYNNNISTINGVIEDLKPHLQTLNDLVDRYGEKRGKRKFLTKQEKTTLLDLLNTLRLSFQKLKTYHDPIVTTYVASIAKLDFEISKLLRFDNILIKNRMKDYLDYFTSSTLKQSIKKVREDIEHWRKNESLLNRGEFHVNVEGIPQIDCRCVYIYILTPTRINNSEFSIEELKIISNLIEKKLISENDLLIKQKYIRNKIGGVGGFVQAHVGRQEYQPYINDGFLRPGVDGFLSHGFSRYPGDNSFEKKYKEKLKTVNPEYREHFNKLLSYASAFNTCQESIIYLNNIISKIGN